MLRGGRRRLWGRLSESGVSDLEPCGDFGIGSSTRPANFGNRLQEPLERVPKLPG